MTAIDAFVKILFVSGIYHALTIYTNIPAFPDRY